MEKFIRNPPTLLYVGVEICLKRKKCFTRIKTS